MFIPAKHTKTLLPTVIPSRAWKLQPSTRSHPLQARGVPAEVTSQISCPLKKKLFCPLLKVVDFLTVIARVLYIFIYLYIYIYIYIYIKFILGWCWVFIAALAFL